MLDYDPFGKEKSVIYSFYSDAKSELELLRDELMNHVPPIDGELPKKTRYQSPRNDLIKIL